MKKLAYVALLIGLTTSTAGIAAAPQGATATKATLSSLIQQVHYGISGLFADVQKIVTDMSSVTTNVNTVSASVEKDLPNEYVQFNTTSSNLETNFAAFQAACKAGEEALKPMCDFSSPGVPGLLSQLSEALATYKSAVTSLPPQTEVTGGVASIDKAVDSLDAGDQTALTTLETDINSSKTNLTAAIKHIDDLLTQIEQASQPQAAKR